MKYFYFILWVLIGVYMNFNFGFFNMFLYYLGSLFFALFKFEERK